jgi:3-hydroxyacyl-CoA dehydrogenase/enoyl-CoA hydratase/3-hydroxybutyryl-CoA epimerase
VLEALRCLEEGVLDSADDADTGSLLGLGFPEATGGVLRWVETEGLGRFVATCSALAWDHGPRFEPSPWLRKLAGRDQGLAAWRDTTPSGDPA